MKKKEETWTTQKFHKCTAVNVKSIKGRKNLLFVISTFCMKTTATTTTIITEI